jgi:hypothetical protein
VDVAKYSAAVMELANIMPATFPARNRYLLDVFFQDIEKVGPAHEILMSFHSAPIAGGEWSVPVSRFEAALADMQAEIAKGDFYLPIVWLKKVAPESAWLSAADEESVQCGIYHSLIEGPCPCKRDGDADRKIAATAWRPAPFGQTHLSGPGRPEAVISQVG